MKHAAYLFLLFNFYLFILKSLLNFLQYCFCFVLWFFGPKACGVLAPWPGIELAPPALEGEVLTTGMPGKSLCFFKQEEIEAQRNEWLD